MNCPLCLHNMERNGKCTNNPHHILSADEVERFLNGEVSMEYLQHRAKIRRGKLARRK